MKNKKKTKKEMSELDRIETLVIKVLKKFLCCNRSIFDPISDILPNYWNNTLYRATKNIMFQRTAAPWVSKNSHIWTLRSWPGNLTTREIAEKILIEKIGLRKLIWAKNGWGNPYKPARKPFFFLTGCGVESKNEFFIMYWKCLEYFVPNEEKRAELMDAIFNIIEDRFQDGLRVGARSYREKIDKDSREIYMNIDLELRKLNVLLNK